MTTTFYFENIKTGDESREYATEWSMMQHWPSKDPDNWIPKVRTCGGDGDML